MQIDTIYYKEFILQRGKLMDVVVCFKGRQLKPVFFFKLKNKCKKKKEKQKMYCNFGIGQVHSFYRYLFVMGTGWGVKYGFNDHT